MNTVTLIVCWNCKSGKGPLQVVRNEKGKKTKDYVCNGCRRTGFHMPPIGNQSFIKEQRLTQKEKDALKEKEKNDKSK